MAKLELNKKKEELITFVIQCKCSHRLTHKKHKTNQSSNCEKFKAEQSAPCALVEMMRMTVCRLWLRRDWRCVER